jgi:DNA-binding MarR family transcriptional regulator
LLEDRSEKVTPVIRESPPIDRLIHEPARYHIMAILYVIESADFLFLRNQTAMTDGNLSSHLSRLEKAGYVHVTKEFVGRKPRTMLSLTDSGRRAFDAYRAAMQAHLELPSG